MKTVNLPENIITALERRAKEKNYPNVDAYVQMILEGVVKKLEQEKKSSSLSADDEVLVKDRLRRLGYID